MYNLLNLYNNNTTFTRFLCIITLILSFCFSPQRTLIGILFSILVLTDYIENTMLGFLCSVIISILIILVAIDFQLFLNLIIFIGGCLLLGLVCLIFVW